MPATPHDPQIRRRLEEVRAQIDAVDDQLVDLWAQRWDLAKEAGQLRRAGGGVGSRDPKREAVIVERLCRRVEGRDIPRWVISTLWRCWFRLVELRGQG